MGIRITSDFSDVYKELDRLSDLPGAKGKIQLRRIMETALMVTQLQVHVDTGSLQASASLKTDMEIGHRWIGVLRYGGESPGINNPVDYAIYEKARGGAHDFFSTIPSVNRLIRKTMKDLLRKSR